LKRAAFQGLSHIGALHSTPHPTSLRSATFSHKGRRQKRRATLMQKVPHYTTLAGAGAIAALKAGSLGVRPLQEYF
jgi:hypothetical protein